MQRPYFRGIESSSFSISFTLKLAVAAWLVAVAKTKEAEAFGLRSSIDQDLSPSALDNVSLQSWDNALIQLSKSKRQSNVSRFIKIFILFWFSLLFAKGKILLL